MKIVARIFHYRITVSGKTQYIDKIEADDPYWVNRIAMDLEYPDALDEWYTPDPNTAHAFLTVIRRWKENTEKHGRVNAVEILEQEDVDPMPYDMPFTGEPGDHVRVVALLDGQRVEVSGATNQIATMIAPPDLYKKLRVEMRKPYEPDTIIGFCRLVCDMYGRNCKFLVQQNLPKLSDIPDDPNIVF